MKIIIKIIIFLVFVGIGLGFYMYQDKITEFYNTVYETKKNTDDLKKGQVELKKELEIIKSKLATLEEKINGLKEGQIKIEYRIEKNNINSKYYNDKIDLDNLNTELEDLMKKYVDILNNLEANNLDKNNLKTRKYLLK